MSLPRVLVLVATYNGEKYLVEQINSILNQKNVDVSVLVADDISNDSTLSILEVFKKKYGNFNYYVNKYNKNFTYNFLDMIFESVKLCGEFDYYALSDQDDVWLENKLIKGIETFNNDNPRLYMSNLDAVDEKLNFICKEKEYGASNYNKYNCIFENICTGCTIIFNKLFLKRILEYYPIGIKYHDYWLFLVAVFTCGYYYDENSYILYRQHDNNQVGVETKIPFYKKMFKLFTKATRIESKLASELINGYKKYISDNDQNFLKKIIRYRVNIFYKFELIFKKEYKSRKENIKKNIKLLFNRY